MAHPHKSDHISTTGAKVQRLGGQRHDQYSKAEKLGRTVNSPAGGGAKLDISMQNVKPEPVRGGGGPEDKEPL